MYRVEESAGLYIYGRIYQFPQSGHPFRVDTFVDKSLLKIPLKEDTKVETGGILPSRNFL